jgi:hypothetical protein
MSIHDEVTAVMGSGREVMIWQEGRNGKEEKKERKDVIGRVW